MRWADMDMLQHVNNVTYVDYLQEARIDMFAAHPEFTGGAELAQGVVVVRHELEFAAPLTFRNAPVAVDAWITEIRSGSFTMASEIYDETPQGRVVYLRASTVLAPVDFAAGGPRRIAPAERALLERYLEPSEQRGPVTSAGASRHVYPVKVRWSDVDAYRHVNNVKYIEYFQEARIAYTMAMHQRGDEFGDIVVARTDVDFRRPMLFRSEPYEVHTWISHVGNTSFTFASEIREGSPASGGPGEVLASAQVIAVGFDRAHQRAAAVPDAHRQRLLEQLALSGLA